MCKPHYCTLGLTSQTSRYVTHSLCHETDEKASPLTNQAAPPPPRSANFLGEVLRHVKVDSPNALRRMALLPPRLVPPAPCNPAPNVRKSPPMGGGGRSPSDGPPQPQSQCNQKKIFLRRLCCLVFPMLSGPSDSPPYWGGGAGLQGVGLQGGAGGIKTSFVARKGSQPARPCTGTNMILGEIPLEYLGYPPAYHPNAVCKGIMAA